MIPRVTRYPWYRYVTDKEFRRQIHCSTDSVNPDVLGTIPTTYSRFQMIGNVVFGDDFSPVADESARLDVKVLRTIIQEYWEGIPWGEHDNTDTMSSETFLRYLAAETKYLLCVPPPPALVEMEVQEWIKSKSTGNDGVISLDTFLQRMLDIAYAWIPGKAQDEIISLAERLIPNVFSLMASPPQPPPPTFFESVIPSAPSSPTIVATGTRKVVSFFKSALDDKSVLNVSPFPTSGWGWNSISMSPSGHGSPDTSVCLTTNAKKQVKLTSKEVVRIQHFLSLRNLEVKHFVHNAALLRRLFSLAERQISIETLHWIAAEIKDDSKLVTKLNEALLKELRRCVFQIEREMIENRWSFRGGIGEDQLLRILKSVGLKFSRVQRRDILEKANENEEVTAESISVIMITEGPTQFGSQVAFSGSRKRNQESANIQMTKCPNDAHLKYAIDPRLQRCENSFKTPAPPAVPKLNFNRDLTSRKESAEGEGSATCRYKITPRPPITEDTPRTTLEYVMTARYKKKCANVLAGHLSGRDYTPWVSTLSGCSTSSSTPVERVTTPITAAPTATTKPNKRIIVDPAGLCYDILSVLQGFDDDVVPTEPVQLTSAPDCRGPFIHSLLTSHHKQHAASRSAFFARKDTQKHIMDVVNDIPFDFDLDALMKSVPMPTKYLKKVRSLTGSECSESVLSHDNNNSSVVSNESNADVQPEMDTDWLPEIPALPPVGEIESELFSKQRKYV